MLDNSTRHWFETGSTQECFYSKLADNWLRASNSPNSSTNSSKTTLETLLEHWRETNRDCIKTTRNWLTIGSELADTHAHLLKVTSKLPQRRENINMNYSKLTRR